MRYKETREQTAELLRMILPLMARHAAGFHPLSYAVWYEYVANTNPRLRAAVDARLGNDLLLTDDDISRLFDEHVAMRDIETSARVRADIEQLVGEVHEVAGEAGAEVQQYGSELTTYERRLRDNLDQRALTGVVSSLIEDTTNVRVKTQVFQEHLKKSTEEVVRLREELELVQGLALTDPLTGLLNRRGFDEQARRTCAAGLRGYSIGIVDIDHFKSINDNHGHLLGDKVIAAVANVLKVCVSGKGHCARIGGEEFAMLLDHTSAAGAAELAERVRAMVERGRIRRADGVEESIGNVTISIGIAAHAEGEALEAVMARADRALYQSKQGGRNRVTVSALP